MTGAQYRRLLAIAFRVRAALPSGALEADAKDALKFELARQRVSATPDEIRRALDGSAAVLRRKCSRRQVV